MVSVGTVLTTVNVALGPYAAQFPERLLAVPAVMLIPRVPSPEIEDNVTVRELLPFSVTEILAALAEPVLLRVTLLCDRVILSAAE